MQIGLDTYSYHLAFGAHGDFMPHKPLDLVACLERAAAIGFAGVQIDPMHLPDHKPAVLQRVRDVADELSLFLEAGIIGIDKSEILDGLRICRAFASPVLRTFIGFDRFSRTTDISACLQKAATALQTVVPALQDEGVVLAIENHGDVTSRELVDLLETIGSPSIGICLDVGNSLCVFEDPVAAARRMAPYAVSCHFKDYRVQMTYSGCAITGVALGQGNIDLPGIAAVLKSAPRLERLFVEIPMPASGGLQQEDEAVKNSLQFCKTVLN